MSDSDCSNCNETETCLYAYDSYNCDRDIYDKVAKISKEKQEEIKKFYYELLEIMRDNDLEGEDFYSETYHGLCSFIGYMPNEHLIQIK